MVSLRINIDAMNAINPPHPYKYRPRVIDIASAVKVVIIPATRPKDIANPSAVART